MRCGRRTVLRWPSAESRILAQPRTKPRPAIHILNMKTPPDHDPAGLAGTLLSALVAGWAISRGLARGCQWSDAFRFQNPKVVDAGHQGTLGYPAWSHDSRFVYFLRLARSRRLERVAVSGGKIEPVADLSKDPDHWRFPHLVRPHPGRCAADPQRHRQPGNCQHDVAATVARSSVSPRHRSVHRPVH